MTDVPAAADRRRSPVGPRILGSALLLPPEKKIEQCYWIDWSLVRETIAVSRTYLVCHHINYDIFARFVNWMKNVVVFLKNFFDRSPERNRCGSRWGAGSRVGPSRRRVRRAATVGRGASRWTPPSIASRPWPPCGCRAVCVWRTGRDSWPVCDRGRWTGRRGTGAADPTRFSSMRPKRRAAETIAWLAPSRCAGSTEVSTLWRRGWAAEGPALRRGSSPFPSLRRRRWVARPAFHLPARNWRPMNRNTWNRKAIHSINFIRWAKMIMIVELIWRNWNGKC